MVQAKAGAKAVKSKSRGKASKARKRKGPGRPEIKVTQADRDRVEVLIGGGMAIDEIAAALDMAVNSLKKHFALELKKGRSKKRAAVLEAMFKAANGGNVSAQKAYLQHNLLADADDKVSSPGKDPEEAAAAKRRAAAAKGKKEIAQEAAMTAGAGTEWGNDLIPDAPAPGLKPN